MGHIRSSLRTTGCHTAALLTRYYIEIGPMFRYKDADDVFSSQNPGQDTYASSVGVMGTSVDALKLVMTSVLSTEPWVQDPNVVKMPWDDIIEASTLARANLDGSAGSGRPLKIGIYWSDNVVRPQPPVSRGVKLVHNVLKHMGHKVDYF